MIVCRLLVGSRLIFNFQEHHFIENFFIDNFSLLNFFSLNADFSRKTRKTNLVGPNQLTKNSAMSVRDKF